jgi:2-dehydropantoate 2-reductase
MRILIAGAGAVGAYIGAQMARAGQDVILFARGPHLRAMQERGIKVESAEGNFEARPRVTGDLQSVGIVDAVLLTVKAHGLTQLAPQLACVFGPHTFVVSTQNGVPWWFFHEWGGEYEGTRIERVDPGGIVERAIEPRRVVGSLVYFATEIVEPGIVRHDEGNRISIGEPSGDRSERVRRFAEALIGAGLRVPVTTRIRTEIWVKLLGNVALNPVSVLTRASLVQMTNDPEVAALVRNIMQEVQAVGSRMGLELPISVDQRIAGASKVGEHKTSMLQDLEAHRPLELEAVVGAVIELGERMGVPMPHTRAVYACTKLLAQGGAVQLTRAA